MTGSSARCAIMPTICAARLASPSSTRAPSPRILNYRRNGYMKSPRDRLLDRLIESGAAYDTTEVV